MNGMEKYFTSKLMKEKLEAINEYGSRKERWLAIHSLGFDPTSASLVSSSMKLYFNLKS